MTSIVRGVRVPTILQYAALLTVLLGCGGKAKIAELDALPFVQLKVVSAGKEVDDASLALYSEEGTQQEVVSVYDSENDCYRFTSTVDGMKKGGVRQGTYTVTVKPPTGSKMRLPAKYADPKTSELKVVIEDGDNFLGPLELNP